MEVAIIGVGRMGQRHLEIAKDLGVGPIAICDSSKINLEGVACNFGIDADDVFDDAGRLFRERQPECVIIATTAPSHFSYAEMAADAGARYILCEKPMAVSLSQCDAMIEKCRLKNATLAVNHQMQFMEQYTEPKRLLNSPEFGGLCSVSVLAGNCGLAMNGTHYFEMFRFLSDDLPSEVTSGLSPERVSNPRGDEFEDKAGSLRITTAGGKRFYMDCSADQGHGLTVVYSARHGQIVVNELTGTIQLTARLQEHWGEPTTRYAMPARSWQTQIAPADVLSSSRSLLDALLNDSLSNSATNARSAVAALVAAHVSSEKGGLPVRVDGNLPKDRVFPWA